MNAPTAGFIGKAVLRREDHRFLTGNGQYTDDIVHQGQTYAVFVRSPHAHAKLLKVDTQAARAAAGVVGVFTGEDFVNVGGLPCG
ncbi:MAG: xanthine dehydrogenase family protein molybdopterin-binding subunit, partial [Betaproteobacteria bacterium]|nr:xanthine dehydrogenase family protein molybdopterin-binding subunit [Betaproteobacteria bacterium]